MTTPKTVRIKDRLYDATTGLPVSESDKPNKSRPTTSATTVHSRTQRAQTLRKRTVKKNVAAPVVKPQSVVKSRPQPGRHMDIARSKKISRFADHPNTDTKPAAKPQSKSDDIPARDHPSAVKAAQIAKTRKAVANQTAKQVKDSAITRAIDATPTKKQAHQSKKPKTKSRRQLWIVAALGLVLVISLAIFFYTPSLSVDIASARAGVNATYPKYIPAGYRLKQPVEYQDGKVSLHFKSTSSPDKFTIHQERNSWDSSAVLDSIVRPATGDNYMTTQEQGLTIYLFGEHAAWVNAGVLYTIDSSATLSGEQLRRIATSL